MASSADKRSRLLESIDKAIDGVRKEIEKAERGEEALDNLDHLRFFLSKLREIRAVLSDDQWRSTPRQDPAMSRVIIDTWPLDDPLGELIRDIEYEYKRLK